MDRVVPLDTTVNGAAVGTWPYVERQGKLHVTQDAFAEWRLSLPMGSQPITVRGQDYWPLRDIPGFSLKVNYAAQAVDITFAPEAFIATKLTRELNIPKPSPVLPSAFLNYDLNLQTTSSRGLKLANDLGVLLEGGISTGLGVLTSTHVGRSLTESRLSTWTRLETTFTRHMPENALTLRLGDSATRSGLWGSSVYFGGIQIGSNYSLTPGFLTQPLPLVSGVSAAPSTVQLYVNDVLRRTSQVPAGPFVIDNVASGISGGGEAKLVVRDILGREVVYVQRFFTSGQLLATDLSDWSVEVGALRENLGIESAQYGNRFLTGTWRRGLTDLITGEVRAEASRKSRAVGIGAIVGFPSEVLGRAALVQSRYDGFGSGTKWILGAERQWPDSTLVMQAQGATRRYTELGRGPDTAPTKLEWALNYSTLLARNWGQAGISVVGVDRYDAPAITTLSANYTKVLPGNYTVTGTVSRAFGDGSSGTLVGVTLSVPLGSSRQGLLSATSRSGGLDLFGSASQSSRRDTDFGWRVLGGRIQNEAHGEAGVYYGGRYGRVFSDISATPSTTSIRTGATGGAVLLGGRTFFTQRVDQSYALVEVKDVPDVGVGLGSSVATRTDREGIALVPYLTPFQQNQVRLNATDVPMSVEVASLEQQVVPMWRSAVKVDFPVRSGRAALVKVVLDDGEPAPAGAIGRIEGDAEEFLVARRGEVYITGLQADSRVRLEWNKQSCVLTLALPPAANDDSVTRVGPIRCAGVKR